MGKLYLNKINQLVYRKISDLLMTSSKDPRLTEVTITDVSVNRDTSRAEVYYSLIGTPEEVQEMQEVLESAAGWLRTELGATLRLRNTPRLVFKYDPSLEYGGRIDALLHQLREDEPDDDDLSGDFEASDAFTDAE